MSDNFYREESDDKLPCIELIKSIPANQLKAMLLEQLTRTEFDSIITVKHGVDNGADDGADCVIEDYIIHNWFLSKPRIYNT